MKTITKRALSLLLSVLILLTAVVLPTSAVELPVSTQAASYTSADRNINFNENWKFNLGSSTSAQNKNFSDTSWETVSIPHDFSITQSFTTSNSTEASTLFFLSMSENSAQSIRPSPTAQCLSPSKSLSFTCKCFM